MLFVCASDLYPIAEQTSQLSALLWFQVASVVLREVKLERQPVRGFVPFGACA